MLYSFYNALFTLYITHYTSDKVLRVIPTRTGFYSERSLFRNSYSLFGGFKFKIMMYLMKWKCYIQFNNEKCAYNSSQSYLLCTL